MQAAQSLVQSRPRTSVLYAVFFLGCLYISRSLQAKATGAFDYILTLSAAIQALAFSVLVLDTRSSVAEGLSEMSLWAFLTAHVTRLSTTFWGQGYVPEDNTSDVYLYQFCELAALCLIAYKLLLLSTVRAVHDAGHGIERWSYLIGMCFMALLLAYFTKATGHNDYFADLSWMFSVWLEAFALFPQVLLLAQAAHVDESALHFASLTFVASFAFAVFWARTARDRYAEFQGRESEHNQPNFFRGILTAAVIRVGLCAVYVYFFVRGSKGLKGMLGNRDYEMCQQDEL